MNLLIHYDFSASSFRAPATIRNIAPGNTSYLYDATMVNNPAINSPGVTTQSSSVKFNSAQQQYITIPPMQTTNNGYTIAWWFKKSIGDVDARIFDFSNGASTDGTGNDNILAAISNENTVGFTLRKGNNVTPVYSDLYSYVYFSNTWMHITWVFNYPEKINIYVNGLRLAPGMSSSKQSNAPYPNAIFRNINYIGKGARSDAPYYNGSIADFRVYNSSLSANDVSSIYTTQRTLNSSTSGNAVLNTGYNELYNQIFCDLFITNSGFNQCQNCNYGNNQEIYSTITQVGEQNCLTACQNEQNCTSYSYDTTATQNNCKLFNTFPSVISNGINGINSGYSLEKYSYDYGNLSPSQKSNVQEKCIAQYLNNYFTPQNQLDVTSCLTNNTTGNNTNISANPECIYNKYVNNGIKTNTVNNTKYEDDPKYNLTYQSDPTIDNYKAVYGDYSNDLVKISNINNKLSDTLNQNDIRYNNDVYNENNNLYNKFDNSVKQKEREINSIVENFENQINTQYINGKLIVLLIIILLIFFSIYIFKKK